MHIVMEELEQYQQRGNHRSVLLFPPLPSRLRYLIHNRIEDRPDLSSFSVGESWCRRVVICYFELRCEEPSSISATQEVDRKPKPSDPLLHKRSQRPEKTLYTPPAAREGLVQTLNRQEPTAEQLLPASAQCVSSSSKTILNPETATRPKDSTTKELFPPEAGRVNEEAAGGSAARHQEEESTFHLQEEEKDLLLEQSRLCFANLMLEEENDEEDPEHQANDEDTNSDMDEFTQLIKEHLKEDAVFSVEHAYKDYSLYENVSFKSISFGHVIEIYNFPNIFTTEDLYNAFTEYSEGGMKIKWVDHTHALGVFSSPSAALHALSINHPLLKARELAKGSKIAQNKALRNAEFIQEVRERPKTDCTVARRMVTKALGIGRGRKQLKTTTAK